MQKALSHKNISKRKKTEEYTVDETLIKVGSELIWLGIVIESENRQNITLFCQKISI